MHVLSKILFFLSEICGKSHSLWLHELLHLYSALKFALCELSHIFVMKVHLIKEQTVWDFCRDHSSAKTFFQEWLVKLKNSDWNTPDDIKATFGTADILGKGSRRVIFNIGGNSYRMICKYKSAAMVHLSIKWIGNHADYDKICGVNKNRRNRLHQADQYTINLY